VPGLIEFSCLRHSGAPRRDGPGVPRRSSARSAGKRSSANAGSWSIAPVPALLWRRRPSAL